MNNVLDNLISKFENLDKNKKNHNDKKQCTPDLSKYIKITNNMDENGIIYNKNFTIIGHKVNDNIIYF
jgi:hypothetical protein